MSTGRRGSDSKNVLEIFAGDSAVLKDLRKQAAPDDFCMVSGNNSVTPVRMLQNEMLTS